MKNIPIETKYLIDSNYSKYDWSLKIHSDRKPFRLSFDLAVLSKIIPSATAVIDPAFPAVWFPGWPILNDSLNTTCAATVVPQISYKIKCTATSVVLF